jgi:ferric-dicitrate binding protein FerR (iron transport regulator)
MSRSTHFKEDLELDQLRETEQQLMQREREFSENRKRLAQERIERECTMPPLEEIQARMERKRHEDFASRREVKNERRAQTRSLMMLLLLITATCTLVWWGVKLMQGGS